MPKLSREEADANFVKLQQGTLELTMWPGPEMYILSNVCPTCHAAVGDVCHVKSSSKYSVPCMFHRSREILGRDRFWTDHGRAPWPEERVPGYRYDSLGDLGDEENEKEIWRRVCADYLEWVAPKRAKLMAFYGRDVCAHELRELEQTLEEAQ